MALETEAKFDAPCVIARRPSWQSWRVSKNCPPVLADALAAVPAPFHGRGGVQLAHQHALPRADLVHAAGLRPRRPDRRERLTLLFVTLALAFALLALSGARHGPQPLAGPRQPASRCPAGAAHPRQMMATDSAAAGQAMRDFDSIRTTMSTPVDCGHVRCAVDPGFPDRLPSCSISGSGSLRSSRRRCWSRSPGSTSGRPSRAWRSPARRWTGAQFAAGGGGTRHDDQGASA